VIKFRWLFQEWGKWMGSKSGAVLKTLWSERGEEKVETELSLLRFCLVNKGLKGAMEESEGMPLWKRPAPLCEMPHPSEDTISCMT
jgi:hypothetical protein